MSDEPAPDEALAAAVDELFADHVPAAHATLDEGAGPPTVLWNLTDQLGFTRVGLAEDLGGSGGSLSDALTILVGAGRHAAPLPLAEGYLGATLLSNARAELPPGFLTVALAGHAEERPSADGSVAVTLRQVAWAETAACVVALVPGPAAARLVAVDPRPWVVRTGEDLAGEPIATLDISATPEVIAGTPVGLDEFFWLGALYRTAQIAGALQTVAELTQRYTQERVQFGRPIGQFQAVQQHIVTVAQAAELTTTSLWIAAHAWARDGGRYSLEIATAKLVANESARVAARAAHQAHGAIGMTREYPLHRYTRRLTLWRNQFGTERQLAARIGRAVTTAPSFARVLSDPDPDLRVPCPR